MIRFFLTIFLIDHCLLIYLFRADFIDGISVHGIKQREDDKDGEKYDSTEEITLFNLLSYSKCINIRATKAAFGPATSSATTTLNPPRLSWQYLLLQR